MSGRLSEHGTFRFSSVPGAGVALAANSGSGSGSSAELEQVSDEN